MPIWLKQITLHPNSAAVASDVLKQLHAMVLRGMPENCYQVNRSEIEALFAGVVPDALHLIVGTSRYANGKWIEASVSTRFAATVFNNVTVAMTRCAWTEGSAASFSDYITFGVSKFSKNDAQVKIDELRDPLAPNRRLIRS